ncbi:uncharacterized protein LOC134194956 [Corticium candelabrum]|uniref:uncharacterized protein LOC134194956 n=1 Tax=Corticium candelabrum TaxID=121492 RepID=UPI002E26EEED|nr:uncharacterized protein LOC134194956 [Corticium candelabrum]
MASESESESNIGLAAGAWQLSLPVLVRGQGVTSTSNEGNLMELEREEASRSAFKPDFLSLSHAVHFPNTLTSSVSETADTNTSYNQSVLADGQSSFSCEEEMAQLDEINAQLNEIKDTILDTTIRSHLLNIDLVAQFNPHTVEALNKTVAECKACIARLEEI